MKLNKKFMAISCLIVAGLFIQLQDVVYADSESYGIKYNYTDDVVEQDKIIMPIPMFEINPKKEKPFHLEKYEEPILRLVTNNSYDINQDGVIDLLDLVIFAKNFGSSVIDSYWDEEEYDILIDIYSKKILNDPYDDNNYFQRARANYFLENYQSAIDDLTMAIEINPRVSQYNNRGYCYEKMYMYDLAIQDYSMALDLDPEYLIALRNRSRAYYYNFSDEEALVDINKAIELDGADPWDYILKGHIYRYYFKDFQEAISLYTKAIELDPNLESAYSALSRLYYSDLEDYELAIVYDTKTIELVPNDAINYYNRGRDYYFGINNYTKAINDFKNVIKLAPESEWFISNTYFYLGYSYRQLGDFDRSIANYTNRLDIDPPSYVAYSNRGWVYYDLNAYYKAIEDFNSSITLNSDYPKAYLGRSQAYNAIGEYTKGNSDYQKYLELGGT